MIDLNAVKELACRDLAELIAKGEPIAGEVLPKNPIRIEVVGRTIDKLQARVMYSDRAPYYFNLKQVE